MNDKILREEAGLVPCGKTDGEMQWLGNDRSWNKYMDLLEEVENQGLRWGEQF